MEMKLNILCSIGSTWTSWRIVADGDLEAGLFHELGTSSFHSRTRYPLEPPASAVMRSFVALGNRGRPSCATSAGPLPQRSWQYRPCRRPKPSFVVDDVVDP